MKQKQHSYTRIRLSDFAAQGVEHYIITHFAKNLDAQDWWIVLEVFT